MDLHKGHKVLPIEDEESLKKENISINDYIKEFDSGAKKVSNLKEKIENEINKINTSFDKVEKDTTKYFESKHEQLLKEEKDIKDKLQTEVTKIKSKLEEYLSLSNAIIKQYEKINKGLKIIENNEKKDLNMIKLLTYVSKLNKNQKEMKKFSEILMKSLKLDFIKDNIQYEEYFFNGLSIPKDIQFSENKLAGFKINWNIDDLNLLNIDKNKIKYKVELREENGNEQFKSIYEGNNKYCTIDKLKSNTNYEIRICSIYEDIISTWSEIKKNKTEESLLLNETKRSDEFLQKLFEWTGGKNMELLYRGTRDGMSAQEFHNRCNNKGPTISLFKNERGYIFGGYSAIDWISSNSYRNNSDNFIFTLTNMYNIEPTKFPNTSGCSIHDCSNYGPTFGGHDIYIGFSSNYSKFAHYKDVLGKGFSIFKGDNENYNFNLKEIEVFKLIK